MQPTLNTVDCHARNSTGVMSVSMETFDHGCIVTTSVLHSNDGLRLNTSQYVLSYTVFSLLMNSIRFDQCRCPVFNFWKVLQVSLHTLNSAFYIVLSVNVKFEVYTAVTMKNVVFWDINTQSVPHRKHYTSATEPSRLMLWKILLFHGGDYEECRLLGYKNPVCTSQETLHLRYRAQPVNAMYDLRFSRWWLRRIFSSVI
jgi:hypothetical protein